MSKFYTNIFHSGNRIFVREVNNDKRRNFVDKYSPYLFVPTKNKSDYKTIHGESVDTMRFSDIKDCKDFVEQYKQVENFNIYGDTDYIIRYIHDKYMPCNYDVSKVKVVCFDLECEAEYGFPDIEMANEKLICITLHDSIEDIYHVVGTGDYHNDEENVIYYHCRDEMHLVDTFIEVFNEIGPDIVTGWNIDTFDIPYLINRIIRLYDFAHAKKLSPWNIVFERTIRMKGQERQSYKIVGVSTLDYIDLYKKFTYTNQESYSLDNIGFVELGEKKLSYDEFINIKDFYKNDYQKFVDYNIKDVQLVNKLEDKLKLIELCMTMAYEAGVNYVDVYSQVKTWDAIIYNHLLNQKIVVPPKKQAIKSKYEGAYVKEPITGMHDWVVSFDLNSLYPNLIVQYNISPETLIKKQPFDVTVDQLLEQTVELPALVNETMAANGTFYSTQKQGFFGELMERMYNERVHAKDKMFEYQQMKQKMGVDDPYVDNNIAKYNTIQMAKKIQLNSAYGALANEYFRFYDVKLAEAITMSGQLSIRWIENSLDEFFNKIFETEDEKFVVAADTDSVYIRLGKLLDNVFDENVSLDKKIDYIDKVCEESIEPFIGDKYKELSNYLNCYRQRMEMSREVVSDKGIWTSKKRYILNVHDNEGVRNKEPYLKVMGIEAVRSSTPYACREKIKSSLRLILNESKESLINFVDSFRQEFKEEEVMEIAFPRSANGINKYYDSDLIYKKGTPIHVRGVLLYNKLLKEHKLERKYPLIQEGEKIKFIYLKLPNILHENIISFPNVLPKEFRLDQYIDYDLQFEKSYMDPLKLVVDAINWDLENKQTLEQFFI